MIRDSIKTKDSKYGFIYAGESEDCQDAETEVLVLDRVKHG